MTYYHGTTEEALVKILRRGIQPNPDVRLHSSAIWVVKDDESAAWGWAFNASDGGSGGGKPELGNIQTPSEVSPPVVLKLKPSATRGCRERKDPHSGVSEDRVLYGCAISPDNIESVIHYPEGPEAYRRLFRGYSGIDRQDVVSTEINDKRWSAIAKMLGSRYSEIAKAFRRPVVGGRRPEGEVALKRILPAKYLLRVSPIHVRPHRPMESSVHVRRYPRRR